MFREQVELKDIENMNPEYRELLGRVVTIQADCEIGGPHLYVKDILPSAPTKADQLVVSMSPSWSVGRIRNATWMPSVGSLKPGRIFRFLDFLSTAWDVINWKNLTAVLTNRWSASYRRS